MNILNIGPAELLFILIIAIIVLGPERMIEIARKLGQYSRQLQNLTGELTSALQSEIVVEENQEPPPDGPLSPESGYASAPPPPAQAPPPEPPASRSEDA